MEKVKLNELADIYLGVTHTPEYVYEGVPFLSVKDISSGKICFDDCKYISQEEYDSLSEGAKPKVGDMLFCRVGTLGKPIIIPEGTPLFGTFVSLGYLRNRNLARCDLNYLRYWMDSASFWKQVNTNVKGASQVNLNTGWLSKFDIDLPDIAEQGYRISVLDKCKSIIESRKKELDDLDDLIKARFVEMFGDPIINSKHLETKDLQDVLIFKAGDFTAASDISDEPSETNPYPCYGGNGIRGYVSEYNQDGEYSLVGRQGALSGNVQFAVGKFKNTEHALLVTPIVEMNNIWLNHLLLNLDLKRYQTGAAQPGLSVKNLQEIQIICAPIDQQNQFADFVKQIDKSKVAIQKALEQEQLLFDSLMQKYFG